MPLSTTYAFMEDILLLRRTLETLSGRLNVLLIDLLEDSLDQQYKETLNETKKEIFTVTTLATDDQVLQQLWTPADKDKITTGPDGTLVSVSFVDSATGTDISQWIEATPDAANPLLFTYSRKPNDDGTQPPELTFFAVGSATIGGVVETAKSDALSFVPGAVATLTAGPATVVTPEAAAQAATPGAGASEAATTT